MSDFNEIDKLVKIIVENEILYRNGSPVISDKEFDSYIHRLKELDPENPVLFGIKGENFLGEIVELPYPMGSLVNVKSTSEFDRWIRTVSTSDSVRFVIMPKLDGISATRKSDKTFISRGDGAENGTDITKYCIFFDKMKSEVTFDCRGEIVVSRKNFKKINEIRMLNGLKAYKSERSAVVGLMQSETPDIKCLSLLEFIPYTILGNYSFDKLMQLNLLSELNNGISITYADYLNTQIINNHEFFNDLFRLWSEHYEIDGLVVEVNQHSLREEIGYETNSYNPKFARAYKVDFEEEKSTIITRIVQQIGKGGSYTPVIQIEPVVLCGNTITNINGDNERFLLWYGLGVGSEITLKKSGNVIPRMTKVGDLEIIPFEELNKLVKEFNGDFNRFHEKFGIVNNYSQPIIDYTWDANFVKIMNPAGTKSDSQNKKKLEFFFSSLNILNVGESMISVLYEAGLNTIPLILRATDEQLLELDNFGKKKVANFRAEIDKRLSLASLESIMHASTIFEKVGETKLKLLNLSESDRKEFTLDELLQINGIGDATAETILFGMAEFWEFYDDIKHRITKSEKKTEGAFDGEIIVFTGFRDKKWVDIIVENGGEYKESLNKNTTTLVYEDSNSVEKSTKVKKAEKDGTNVVAKSEFAKRIDTVNFKKSVDGTNAVFGSLL